MESENDDLVEFPTAQRNREKRQRDPRASIQLHPPSLFQTMSASALQRSSPNSGGSEFLRLILETLKDPQDHSTANKVALLYTKYPSRGLLRSLRSNHEQLSHYIVSPFIFSSFPAGQRASVPLLRCP